MWQSIRERVKLFRWKFQLGEIISKLDFIGPCCIAERACLSIIFSDITSCGIWYTRFYFRAPNKIPSNLSCSLHNIPKYCLNAKMPSPECFITYIVGNILCFKVAHKRFGLGFRMIECIRCSFFTLWINRSWHFIIRYTRFILLYY